ncbi:MAG: hypothetical protein IPP19_01595 [Verrucomicrobia bacterium]|nr:hypothetical protein [Verrucomicrobiota bacterium]
MTSLSTPVLAEAAKVAFEPLFGNQWLALLVILAGIAVFMIAVAAVGRWLAATHPDEPPPPAPVIEPAPSTEIFAAIAAAVAVTFGGKARIANVQPTKSQRPGRPRPSPVGC